MSDAIGDIIEVSCSVLDGLVQLRVRYEVTGISADGENAMGELDPDGPYVCEWLPVELAYVDDRGPLERNLRPAAGPEGNLDPADRSPDKTDLVWQKITPPRRAAYVTGFFLGVRSPPEIVVPS